MTCELPYLVKSDESLPSVLQKLLDSHSLRFNLVVCGSSQQMMFDIALNESSPLYGRADEILRLNPIPASYMSEALDITPNEVVKSMQSGAVCLVIGNCVRKVQTSTLLYVIFVSIRMECCMTRSFMSCETI